MATSGIGATGSNLLQLQMQANAAREKAAAAADPVNQLLNQLTAGLGGPSAQSMFQPTLAAPMDLSGGIAPPSFDTGIAPPPAATGDSVIDMINSLAAGTGAPVATEQMFQQQQSQQSSSSGGVTSMQDLMANVQAIVDASGGQGAVGTSASFLLQGLQLMTEKVDPSDPNALAKQAQDMQTFMEYMMNPKISAKIQSILKVAEMSPDQLAQSQQQNAEKEADADNVLRSLGYDPNNLVADLGTAGANGTIASGGDSLIE